MKQHFRHLFRSLVLAAVIGLLGACSTLHVGSAPTLEAGAKWAILPFVNQTETPQAGLRAESIAESLLRVDGISNLRRYPAALNTETLFEPMDRKQFDAALAWARGENIRYALTGSVDEWRYKVGIDGEPAAGVTLQLIDVQSGQVLWAAAGGSTGWSRESLSGVAQKLLAKLLRPLLVAAR
ncbi:penicillin-binding protein activator LpoB [Actimicrobium sp. CCC2.4]|uniref:penicillin-binding protein activator LpoB n=1 Tax=Actimicrobium sp. CCC2.4 TaxID=3048606 RepID=UPI002AC8DEC0|nr:penicillin-binding protein activator LpoB [Actimicrobium sp. CCC2.4]MEB0134079.1 penicillin-binding protein activator LpoB [Actimicrobium sp. CCC2.4]WPX31611.1 penicillin-binding protein activator LpoB [Actimicrobium sp. CCC2.4]